MTGRKALLFMILKSNRWRLTQYEQATG
jgi:hypothetical protein